MDKDNNYNFYALGQRLADDAFIDLRKKMKEIEKEFGKDAALEFEAGIASTISTYEYVDEYENDIDYENIGGTKDFGDYALRNNSYFENDDVNENSNRARRGFSRRFRETPDGREVYNPPRK